MSHTELISEQRQRVESLIDDLADSDAAERAAPIIVRLEDKEEQLRAVLVKSIEVIQTWHNMSLPAKEASTMWDIYWRNAPEMKLIREALSDEERAL